jgi:hypothetical protein
VPAPSTRRIGAIDRRTTSRKARLAFSIRSSGRRPAPLPGLGGRPLDHSRPHGRARRSRWWDDPPTTLRRRRLRGRGAIDDFAPLEVADDGTVARSAFPRPVVNADRARRRIRLRCPSPDQSEQRVLAYRHQQPPGEALAGPAAEREAEMVDDGLQPRRAASVSPSGQGACSEAGYVDADWKATRSNLLRTGRAIR